MKLYDLDTVPMFDLDIVPIYDLDTIPMYNLDPVYLPTTEITLPSPQYYLSVSNETTATLSKWFSTITAREIGETDIILKDRSILRIVILQLLFCRLVFKFARDINFF